MMSCTALSSRVMDSNGETIILSSEGSCIEDECLEGSFDPIIDYADLENVDMTDDESLDTTDENISEEITDEEICDDQTDSDGDGIPCNCDTNDNSARNFSLKDGCDNDSDGVPNSYDLCPNKDDSEDVITVYLCDDEEEFAGIIVDVDYDDARWTESNCFLRNIGQAREFPTQQNPDNLGGVQTKASVDFPIAYIFLDDNNNGKADGCDNGAQVSEQVGQIDNRPISVNQ